MLQAPIPVFKTKIGIFTLSCAKVVRASKRIRRALERREDTMEQHEWEAQILFARETEAFACKQYAQIKELFESSLDNGDNIEYLIWNMQFK